jgi:hypothetical protein
MRNTVVVAQDGRVSQEVLESGPRAPRSGLPTVAIWALGIGALVLLTLANVLVAAELGSRTFEAEALVTSVEASESAMKATQEEFSALIDGYDTDNLTDDQRQELRRELTRLAQRGQARIALAGVGVADVAVLPWHSSIIDAQRAYLAHNQAWVDYMAAAAEDPAEWFRPQPDVNATFNAAEKPLMLAVPFFDLLQTLPRVEMIYITGGGDGGGQAA